MVHKILVCWLHILMREQMIFNILTISTNAWNSEASFLSLQLYKNMLFHLRVALVGAETCSKLVLVIIFMHNKYFVIDRIYLMFDWLTNTRDDLLKDLFIKQLARERNAFQPLSMFPFPSTKSTWLTLQSTTYSSNAIGHRLHHMWTRWR